MEIVHFPPFQAPALLGSPAGQNIAVEPNRGLRNIASSFGDSHQQKFLPLILVFSSVSSFALAALSSFVRLPLIIVLASLHITIALAWFSLLLPRSHPRRRHQPHPRLIRSHLPRSCHCVIALVVVPAVFIVLVIVLIAHLLCPRPCPLPPSPAFCPLYGGVRPPLHADAGFPRHAGVRFRHHADCDCPILARTVDW